MLTTKIQKPLSLLELCSPWLERLALLTTKIQKPVSLLMLLAALCLLAGIFLSAVGAQEKKPRFMGVEGHGYEPAKVEALPATVRQAERLLQWGDAMQGATHTGQPKPLAEKSKR